MKDQSHYLQLKSKTSKTYTYLEQTTVLMFCIGLLHIILKIIIALLQKNMFKNELYFVVKRCS